MEELMVIKVVREGRSLLTRIMGFNEAYGFFIYLLFLIPLLCIPSVKGEEIHC